ATDLPVYTVELKTTIAGKSETETGFLGSTSEGTEATKTMLKVNLEKGDAECEARQTAPGVIVVRLRDIKLDVESKMTLQGSSKSIESVLKGHSCIVSHVTDGTISEVDGKPPVEKK
ncbi:MAG: hypothetical protein V4692_11350, partial [Bdellovibrionota bacterium]